MKPADAIAAFRPRDPRFVADPYPIYATLRDHAPIGFHPELNYWLVSRYSDVAALLRDPLIGHAEQDIVGESRAVTDPAPGPLTPVRLIETGQALADAWLSKLNPPRHGDVRSVVQRLFAPARLAGPVAHARDHAERLFGGSMRFDGVADLARPVSMQTIARVLGLSTTDADRLSPHVETLGPAIEVDADPATQAAGWFALASMNALLEQMMRDPPDRLDPSGALFRLHQAIAADPATADALFAQCSLLLFAGHATTQSLIANMLHALATHPHVLAEVRAGAISSEAVVEETLRFDPPAHIAARSALGAVTIGAQRIEPGERLLLLLGSANRDPHQFADADRFNPKRSRAVHLAFGGGIHACIGMALARMEARVVLEALVAKGVRLSLEGPPRWSNGLSVRSLARLPMVFEEER